MDTGLPRGLRGLQSVALEPGGMRNDLGSITMTFGQVTNVAVFLGGLSTYTPG